MKSSLLDRGALAGALLLTLAATLPGGATAAECPLLDPEGSGANGQTLTENFQTLVDDLYAGSPASGQDATREIQLEGGQTAQAPPWFDSSTDCATANLKNYNGAIPSPSFSDYLVVSDELSELAIVTALADDDDRMMKIHRMVQAMESADYAGLPCWLARVAQVSGNTYTVDCIESASGNADTASDATARFGLAYYFAAANPSFPANSQSTYRLAGNALAARHLEVEYADWACHTSSVTGSPICHWIAGGGDTAAAGLGGLEMWIGYHQDVVRFLLAAYRSTGQAVYLARAEEVADQWLVASTFDGVHATFGRLNFGWNTGVIPIAPEPGDPDWWVGNLAWDEWDAPRALWMGDVLRAHELATVGAPLPPAYQKLSAWVQAVLAGGHQTANTSCIDYNQDGTVGGNCSNDYFNNGLGAGLLTYHGSEWLESKIDEALSQYNWNSSKTWNSTQCFGIYSGVRPLKALASAIGLDTAAFGECGCSPPPSPPAVPFSLQATPVSTSRIDLQWADNSSDEDGFDVERKQGGGAWTTLLDAPANATTYQSTGLACGTSYTHRVRAFSGAGTSGYSNEAPASTLSCPPPPAAPSWLRVTAVSGSRIDLRWDDNSNNEDGFSIERKQGCCGPWTPLPNAPANAITYQSTGLACGTSYAYRVRAFNAAGSSAPANEAATFTLACP